MKAKNGKILFREEKIWLRIYKIWLRNEFGQEYLMKSCSGRKKSSSEMNSGREYLKKS
jgi:hypothetical protein